MVDLDGRITPFAKYGEHIPLFCVNHPDLRWHTKNIGGIGARSIFFTGSADEKYDNNYSEYGCIIASMLRKGFRDFVEFGYVLQYVAKHKVPIECSCSIFDLMPVVK